MNGEKVGYSGPALIGRLEICTKRGRFGYSPKNVPLAAITPEETLHWPTASPACPQAMAGPACLWWEAWGSGGGERGGGRRAPLHLNPSPSLNYNFRLRVDCRLTAFRMAVDRNGSLPCWRSQVKGTHIEHSSARTCPCGGTHCVRTCMQLMWRAG